MPKQILFVDSDKYQLNALKRSFRREKAQWKISVAKDAVAALRTILDESVDILVTETKLSGMDGLELLELVRQRFPRIIRIVLSGNVERDVVLKSVGIAHQYLAKPCDDTELKTTVSRAYMLRDILPDETLKTLASHIRTLPSLPRVYVEINRELNSDDPSIDNVANIVSQDPSVMAKLFQMVNSSFFGLPQPISQPLKAVSLLGLDLVKAVVLASGVFAAFKEVVQAGFSMDQLWKHAMRTGAMAKAIAEDLKVDRATADYANMAGLLHDVGAVLVAAQLPESYVRAVKLADKENISLHRAEISILGTSHAELGAYLLGLWGLSDPIVAATAYHHRPQAFSPPELTVLTFVHIANALEKAAADVVPTRENVTELDWDYLEGLDLASMVAHWSKQCRVEFS